MKAGQRIKIIREISKKLSENYEWSDIDLIFSQFKIRTSDVWEGDAKSYVIDMIGYADDEQLIELNDFIKEEIEEVGVPQLTKSVQDCWTSGDTKIFISHSSKNKVEVKELKECLSRYNIAAFVAHEDIHPTEEWQEEILCGLDSCDAIIAWSTPEFETSVFAQQEIGIAIAKRKPILSIRRGIDPVGFTSRQQGIKGNDDMGKIAKSIVDVLMKKPSLQKEVQESLLSSFERSWSFADAREKMSLLEQFNEWEPDQISRMKSITNGQVLSSHGVPERIEGLIKKFTPVPEEVVDLPF